ncbi:MAG TPA: hypothetical protein PKA41_18100 [Verrucomicrobiota bacterium]|nr:hypothetical protein [Verrucomicrobiota bacterium]
MTILHMDNGRLVVPKDVRTERGYDNGSTFSFIQTRSGALVFKPTRPAPKLNLIEHLMKFKGVVIPEMKFSAKPRV